MDISLEDLAAHPEKYGIPSAAEVFRGTYSKRDQFCGREDDEIAAVDRGDPVLGCIQRYYITDGGQEYRVESLECAERIAMDMGLKLFHDFNIDPQLTPDDGCRKGFYNRVTFRSKRSVEKRLSR
jgi:hypothetical protein